MCYETLGRPGRFLLMTDHPMFLEYDWISNTYRSRLSDVLMSGEHSFGTLAAARHALHLVGLRVGVKTDRVHGGSNSWNPSPTALMPPVWEVGGPIGSPVKRPRSPLFLPPVRFWPSRLAANV
jgi:hypothetical protein